MDFQRSTGISCCCNSLSIPWINNLISSFSDIGGSLFIALFAAVLSLFYPPVFSPPVSPLLVSSLSVDFPSTCLPLVGKRFPS